MGRPQERPIGVGAMQVRVLSSTNAFLLFTVQLIASFSEHFSTTTPVTVPTRLRLVGHDEAWDDTQSEPESEPQREPHNNSRPVSKAAHIACGSAHSICVTVSGEVLVWGRGKSGRLGLGPSTRDRYAPVLLRRRDGWGESGTCCWVDGGCVFDLRL